MKDAPAEKGDSILKVKNVNAWYSTTQALKDISFDIERYKVTALIGPSGCGKSTLIRCFNRMNDFIPTFKLLGQILLEGADLYSPAIDPVEVRLRLGMVFQKQNPFPKSIYENVAYGPRISGVRNRLELDTIVEESLKKAALWDEVEDKLKDNAYALSGGQQQRLCIARTLAIDPEVLLLDEPCSALDPIATGKIEELILELKDNYTVLIVTHNMQQAARVSDYTAFLYLGETDRVRCDGKNIHEPGRFEDRSLHHRQVWLNGG